MKIAVEKLSLDFLIKAQLSARGKYADSFAAAACRSETVKHDPTQQQIIAKTVIKSETAFGAAQS